MFYENVPLHAFFFLRKEFLLAELLWWPAYSFTLPWLPCYAMPPTEDDQFQDLPISTFPTSSDVSGLHPSKCPTSSLIETEHSQRTGIWSFSGTLLFPTEIASGGLCSHSSFIRVPVSPSAALWLHKLLVADFLPCGGHCLTRRRASWFFNLGVWHQGCRTSEVSLEFLWT